MQLSERRRGDAVCGEIAVMAAVGPHHHLHAALLENSAQRESPHTERRAKPNRPDSGNLLEHVLRAVDLGGHRLSAGEIEIRMRPGVVSDHMTLVADAAHELRVALGARAAQEEGRLDAVGAQDVEDLAGVRHGRAVVEGEHHFGRIDAAHQRGAKQGRLRRAEAVREHADDGERQAGDGGGDSQTRILHRGPHIVSIILECARPLRFSTRPVRTRPKAQFLVGPKPLGDLLAPGYNLIRL